MRRWVVIVPALAVSVSTILCTYADGARVIWAESSAIQADTNAPLTLRLQPQIEEAVALYERACESCREGELADCEEHLLLAVKAGFNAFSVMQREPDLALVRGGKTYANLLGARDFADPFITAKRVQQWQARSELQLTQSSMDEDTRLVWLHQDMQDIDDLKKAVQTARATLRQIGLPDRPRHYVTLVVSDNRELLSHGVHTSHGRYRHLRREMIVRPTTQAISHEFVHACHHSHMDAVSQQHPLWIQEGLACALDSLHDHDTHKPDDRLEYAQALLRAGQLPRLASFMMTSDASFIAHPGTSYAIATTIITFLQSHEALSSWYTVYVEGYEFDPTGLDALEQVFDASAGDVDQQFRQWLRAHGPPALAND